MCFLSVKMHCHMGQTNRPCPSRYSENTFLTGIWGKNRFFTVANCWQKKTVFFTVANCWQKTLQTEREATGSTAGWVAAAAVFVSQRGQRWNWQNLHINHSDYLYHQHRDDHQVEQHILLIIMITTLGFNIVTTIMMNVMRIIVMTDTMFITTSSNPNTTWRPASLPEKAR